MSDKVGIDDFLVHIGGGAIGKKKALDELPVFEIIGNSFHIPLILSLCTATELRDMNLPERQAIVEGVLEEGSVTLVHGKTGVGKSWFVLWLAHVLTNGGDEFLAWKIKKHCRVLIVDGEMPLWRLQSRLRYIGAENDLLTLLPSEALFRNGDPLNLNELDQQARVLRLLEELRKKGQNPDVLIFDNLSSLTSGGDENSNSDQDVIQQFWITLRHLGYTVLVVHHSGKGGDQRGASRRTDLMDSVINLTESSDVSADTSFDVTFDKVRGARPEPDTLTVHIKNHGSHVMVTHNTTKHRKWMMWEEILRVVKEHSPDDAKSIAKHFGRKPVTIRQHLKRARDGGYLEKGRRPILTQKGLDYLKTLEGQPEQKF